LKINGFADRLKLNIGFSYRFLENPVQVLELVFFSLDFDFGENSD